MDRLDAMHVLLAVVDAGSLSAGSRKLRAPLPSVSRKVAELERHLGTRLLIRTSRNIQLTDAGRDYIDAVRQIMAQVSDAESRAAGEYEVPRGELRITVPDEFGHRMVLPIAYEFLREHSEINLDIITTNSFIDLVEERIDIGVRIGHLPDSSLYATGVGDARVLTCASPKYLERKGIPRTPADMNDHDAILLGNFSRAWAYPGSETPDAVPLRRVHANDATAACDAAVWGLGIARLPNFVVNDHLKSGALVEILKDFPTRSLPVHLVYMKQGLLPLKVRAFIDWVAPRLREAVRSCDESAP
jgi:DNA-binding transcriptional LysR family regulator